MNRSSTDRQSGRCRHRGAVEEEEELLVVHRGGQSGGQSGGHGGHRGSADSVEFNSRASSVTTDSFCERGGGGGSSAESEESLQERLR